MSDYSYDQYVAAGKKAVDAGDIQSANEIAAQMDQLFPEAPEAPASLEKAWGSISDVPGQAYESVTKGLEEFTTQAAGPGTENVITGAANVVRPGLEIVGDIAGAGMDTWMATYGKIPGVKTAIDMAGDSDIVQKGIEYAKKGIKWWDQFSTQHPTEAKIMEDVGVLAEVGIPRFKALDNIVPDRMTETGKKLRRMGNQQHIDDRRAGILEMVAPDNKVGDGTTGETGVLFKETTYDGSPLEVAITETLETFPKVNPKKSYAHNLGTLNESIKELQGKAEKLLKKNHRNRINTDDLIEELDLSVADIRKIPGYQALRGDAEAIARDYLYEATRILKDSKKTPMGLLEARREFDRIVNEGGDIYGTPNQTAKKVAAKHIRDLMNEKLLKSVGAKQGDELYDLINRQHYGLLGMDKLKVKKAGEANSSVARVFDELSSKGHLPSTLLGLAATGSFAMGSPVFGGALAAGALGASGMHIFRGLKGHTIKRNLGSLIGGLDKAIKSETNDVVLSQLKADRVILVELLKSEASELEQMANSGEAQNGEAEQ